VITSGYPEVQALLPDLLSRMRAALGERLLGLYLYGSLVWGDFDLAVSDIDLLAVTAELPSAEELTALGRLHADFATERPAWRNRIEVQYASREYLATFRERRGPIAVISPGEPFHVVDAGDEWKINWYFVLAYGQTLAGPAPSAWIAPIGQAEFVAASRELALNWRERIGKTAGSRPYQSYSILTLCRAWYTCATGRQSSKRQAAAWAAERLPEHAPLIASALEWRANANDTSADPAATFPATERLVRLLLAKIAALEDGSNHDDHEPLS
jgi:predicted nucleotidyltransferase